MTMLLTAHPKNKSVHITDDTRTYLEKKLQKLQKLFRHEPEAQLTLGFESGQPIVEVTVHSAHIPIISQYLNIDLHAAIDRMIDRLDSHLKRFKTNRIDNHRQHSALKAEGVVIFSEEEIPVFQA